MNFRISFFAAPSAPNALARMLSQGIGRFDALDLARQVARDNADNPNIGKTHSFIVESMDDDSIMEHWIRDESGWRQENA
jgi:hypothetical protein